MFATHSYLSILPPHFMYSTIKNFWMSNQKNHLKKKYLCLQSGDFYLFFAIVILVIFAILTAKKPPPPSPSKQKSMPLHWEMKNKHYTISWDSDHWFLVVLCVWGNGHKYLNICKFSLNFYIWLCEWSLCNFIICYMGTIGFASHNYSGGTDIAFYFFSSQILSILF